MKLADIIDIEHQLIKENELDPVQIRIRDRKIGQQLQRTKIKNSRLFSAWLERVRSFSENSPGTLIETGYRWLGIILLLFGLIIGSITARSVLDYDGTNPVNIINFLAIIIGLQWIVILFFLLNQLPQRLKNKIPLLGEFYSIIRELIYHASKIFGKIFHHLPIQRNNELLQSIFRIRKRNRAYQKIEKWLIVGLTHRYNIAFNIGAFLTCLYLISFSDLAFAWNTTLNIESSTFHTFVSYLAKPWALLFPESVPSIELVEMSRYFRLDSSYAGSSASDPIIVGKWWSFLILSLLFYGFLPRLVIFTFANIKLKYYLTHPRRYSAYFESLYERLTEPIIETRSHSLSEETQKNSKKAVVDYNFDFKHKQCITVKWGDIQIRDRQINSIIEDQFGCKSNLIFSAGSYDYESSNDATLKSIQMETSQNPIIMLIESWETPDASLSYFLSKLRNNTETNRHIVILLLDTANFDDIKSPNEFELTYWSKFVSTISDPYLHITTIAENS